MFLGNCILGTFSNISNKTPERVSGVLIMFSFFPKTGEYHFTVVGQACLTNNSKSNQGSEGIDSFEGIQVAFPAEVFDGLITAIIAEFQALFVCESFHLL